MIQAYPDAEYERIAKAVLDMPISNAIDRKERFPKELPRRMFPSVENLQAQQRCAAALSSEGVGPLRKTPKFPPPPPKTQGMASAPNFERERSPYVSRPDPRASETEEEMESSSFPIERERKPYSATPGAGKTYNDDLNRSIFSDGASDAYRRRAQSTTGPAPYAPPSKDAYYQPRTGSHTTSGRPRSPTSTSYGTQSDPNVQDIPSSYYASNLHKFDDETRRYNRDVDGNKFDRRRKSTAETDGSFDSHTRSVYDDDDYRGRGGSNGYDSKGYDSRRY